MMLGSKDGPNTTSPKTCRSRIRFALIRFRSLLLTESQLISSPSGTKTFQFPEFPTITGLKGSPIRKFLVQCPHAARQDFSQLATSFIGEKSRVLHLSR